MGERERKRGEGEIKRDNENSRLTERMGDRERRRGRDQERE